MTDPVIARLAAANPVAHPSVVVTSPVRRFGAHRRIAAIALALAAVAVPAGALADDVGGLLGVSAQGQSVPTSGTPFAQVTALSDALEELGFPTTLQLLARRDGISFYVARKADGVLCFAVDAGAGKAVGCDFGSAHGAAFPSPERPILDLSRFSNGARLAGFAADGVSRVVLFNAAGATIASAPVIENVYANANPPAGAVGVEAFDARGAGIYRRTFDEAP